MELNASFRSSDFGSAPPVDPQLGPNPDSKWDDQTPGALRVESSSGRRKASSATNPVGAIQIAPEALETSRSGFVRGDQP